MGIVVKTKFLCKVLYVKVKKVTRGWIDIAATSIIWSKYSKHGACKFSEDDHNFSFGWLLNQQMLNFT